MAMMANGAKKYFNLCFDVWKNIKCKLIKRKLIYIPFKIWSQSHICNMRNWYDCESWGNCIMILDFGHFWTFDLMFVISSVLTL